MKKNFLIGTVVIVMLLVVGTVLFFVQKGKKNPPREQLQNEERVAEVSIEEKPYVALIPREDGKELTLKIDNLNAVSTVEYELVYLSQDLSRGVVGSIDIKDEKNVSRKLLLGSCSKNVCKYDEGIEKGTLTLRFRGPTGVRKFMADFHFQRGDKELTSIDGKFRFAGKISPSAYYLTMSTIGLPSQVEAEVIAGPYGVFTSGPKKIKNGVLELVLSEPKTSAKIYFWDGKTWAELETELNSEQTLSAAQNFTGIFVATSVN